MSLMIALVILVGGGLFLLFTESPDPKASIRYGTFLIGLAFLVALIAYFNPNH